MSFALSNEDDYDHRVQILEITLILTATELLFCLKILWTDEATFKLIGPVNRHDYVLTLMKILIIGNKPRTKCL